MFQSAAQITGSLKDEGRARLGLPPMVSICRADHWLPEGGSSPWTMTTCWFQSAAQITGSLKRSAWAGGSMSASTFQSAAQITGSLKSTKRCPRT